jgi:hypothetical protein
MKVKSYNALSIIVGIAATLGCFVGFLAPVFLGIEERTGAQDVDSWAFRGWIVASMVVGGFVFGGIAKLILHGLLEEMPEKPAPDWKTFSRKEWGIAAVCWLCLAAGLVVAILFGKDIPIAGGILPIFVGSIPLCAFGIVQDAKKKRRIGKRTETGTP